MNLNLYIDSNTYLSFYHFTSDDLEEFRKLMVLLDKKRVILHLPIQTIHEFRRNRDSKISDALTKFQEEKVKSQFPQICKEYEEYETLRALIRQYQETKSALLEKLNADAANDKLKADEIIKQLFEKATEIEITPDIISKAKYRFDIGNPPGKDKSYGDAINWEALLATVPKDQDLYFITDDRDYCSRIDNEEFSPFLKQEWKEQKGSDLFFFKRMSAFFNEQFPDIKLATELEKDLLIKDLSNSVFFRDTRRILQKLSQFSEFTNAQLNDIVAAAITNNQIYWIITDEDINAYIRGFIKGKEDQIEEQNLSRLKKMLGEEIEVPDEDLPF